MVYNHLEEEHLHDDNHQNFVVIKASETNNVSVSKECNCIDNQGRDQDHLERNNETMILCLCGFLFLFVCYGMYLLFK